MPQVLVIDASVVAKWFLPELDSEAALTLARRAAAGSVSLHAPDIWASECASAIWKQAIRLRRMDPGRARAAITRLANVPIRDAASRLLLPRAYAIASAADIAVYDALYVTLGEVLSAQVITADRVLIRRLTGTPWAERLRAL